MSRFRSVAIVVLALLTTAPTRGQQSEPSKAEAASSLQIDQVLSQIQAALSKVQTEAASTNLPALHSVDLELKAEFSTAASGELNLYVVTVGGAIEGQTTQRVLLTMVPPPPYSERPIAAGDVTESLSSAILAAAKGIANAQKRKPPLNLSRLEVEVQFAVKDSGSAGVKLEIFPITASMKGEIKSSAIQTAKVIFQAAENKK
jgi:hypothetical protein